MATDGLRLVPIPLTLVTAAVLLLPILTPAAEDSETAVSTSLAIQNALMKGSDHLKHFEYQEAVQVLESQLAKINGNRQYLTALRDAYRGYIDQLRKENKEGQARLYMRRLMILDGKGQERIPAAEVQPTEKVAAMDAEPETDLKGNLKPKKPQPLSKSDVTVRGQSEDPFSSKNIRDPDVRSILKQADSAFEKRQFADAGRLYQKAFLADKTGFEGKEDRWAYCRLDSVVRQLNQSSNNVVASNTLEEEVEQVMKLSPRLEKYGKDLLVRIREREKESGRPDSKTENSSAIAIRHEKSREGWETAQSANFRVHYTEEGKDQAERALIIAEKTRKMVARKWFGEDEAQWTPFCEVYLYNDAQAYAHETGKPTQSPGHSTVTMEAGRVLSRRIDLHCDEPTMLAQRLPHETTHVVMAGQFGDQPLPRWADEGLAVMAEPEDEIARYLKRLQDCLENRQLYYFNKLLEMQDYPEARRIDAFYCESVSLVEFLLKEKDARTLTSFLREAQKIGSEAALKKHYGFTNYGELQRQWELYAFGKIYTRAETGN